MTVLFLSILLAVMIALCFKVGEWMKELNQ